MGLIRKAVDGFAKELVVEAEEHRKMVRRIYEGVK